MAQIYTKLAGYNANLLFLLTVFEAESRPILELPCCGVTVGPKIMGPISLACAIAHCMASAPTASAIEYCCISLSNGLTDSMQSRRVKQVRILTDRFDPTENVMPAATPPTSTAA